MKKIVSFLFLLAIVGASTFFYGCSKDSSSNKKTVMRIYTPVYMTKAQALASVNGAPSTVVKNAGKLYIKDNYIFLNEVNKGIHVIDNSNPSSPTQVAFISIPGNLDIAVKGNILYADMYSDLLAIDISNIHQVKITKSLNNFFTGRTVVNNHQAIIDDKIAVDWNEKDTMVSEDYLMYPGACNNCGVQFESFNNVKSGAGIAGSMASMVLLNNYIYAISEMHSLGIVDVSDAKNPKLDSSFFAGFDLETIYPFENKLFLGSQEGVFMYDVSNPQQPAKVGEFSHGRACDPVISDGNFAYVTLHAGTSCGGDANELDVVDVKDVANSKLVKSYNLTKPNGLSKDGNLLFVCDENTVKVYNASNPESLALINMITCNDAYDVIAYNKRLIVVAAKGLYQYDYSDAKHIRQLSFFATQHQSK